MCGTERKKVLTKTPVTTFRNILFATPRETATCVKISPGKTGLMHSFLQLPEQHSTVQHFFPSTQSSFDEQLELELWCAHVDEDFVAGHTLLSGTSIIIKTDIFIHIEIYLRQDDGNRIENVKKYNFTSAAHFQHFKNFLSALQVSAHAFSLITVYLQVLKHHIDPFLESNLSYW